MQTRLTDWASEAAGRKTVLVEDEAEDACVAIGNEMATGALQGCSENADSGFFA